MRDWIESLFKHDSMLKKGHCQRKEDSNLGMGWIYYGLVRLMRCRTVVIIGSYRGFSPIVFARGLADNLEGGQLTFIDPSFVDDFWQSPERVRQHFHQFSIMNVRHFLMTTQQFVETEEYRSLSDIGLVFVDGYHSYEQARFDFEAFEKKMSPQGIILFHDSIEVASTAIYGPEKVYDRRVRFFLDELKERQDLQAFDIPMAKGLTLVSKKVRS